MDAVANTLLMGPRRVTALFRKTIRGLLALPAMVRQIPATVIQLKELDALLQRSSALEKAADSDRVLFKNLPATSRSDVQFFDRLYKFHGPLRSTADMNSQTKLDAELHFHFREKAEVALTTGSSWYGGDYFEFGSHDLNTFRNMLTAYDICGMTQQYKDMRFYAFDVFGDLDESKRIRR